MRTEIERRLLVVGCIGLAIGVAGASSPLRLLLLIPLLFFVRPPAAKAAAAVACLLGAVVTPDLNTDVVRHPELYRGVVTVESVPKLTARGWSCEVGDGTIRMVLAAKTQRVDLGDRFEVKGVVDPPFETEDRMFRSRGLVGRLRPVEFRIVSRGSAFHRAASGVRDRFREFSARTLQPRSAATVDALCFNVDADLDQDFRRNLTRTGTIHIVSTSGMHVVIVAFALLWLLSRFPVPRSLQLAVLAAVLVFYASAAGLRPPVVRSVVMAMAVLTAYLWRREADWLSAMALAGGGYILFSPASLFDVGFQLSFVAVASLGLFGRVWRGGPVNATKSAIHASLVASAGTAPLVAYHFGSFSIVAVLANLLIGFAVAPIVVLSLVAMGLDAFAPAFAETVMRSAVEPLSGWIMAVADTMGPWRLAAVDTPEFSAWWLLPVYGALLCLWRRRPVEA